MNQILQLKGSFEQKSANKPGHVNIPTNRFVLVEHLNNLKDDLKEVLVFWQKEKILPKPLISAYYKETVAKSNRIKGMFGNSAKQNNETIVGAKFSGDSIKKHIITHCVEFGTIIEAIRYIEKVILIIEKNFGNSISDKNISDINNKKHERIFLNPSAGIKKSRFVNILVDAYYLEKFGVERDTTKLKENAIVTIYKTGIKTTEIMEKIGIKFSDARVIDDTTILLTPDQFSLLKAKAPYLISMAVSDISLLDKEDFCHADVKIATIPEPANEPTVGVIDTMFKKDVYFSKWVDFRNMLDSEIQLSPEDYKHGTMVSSIIVDGSSINPNLNDGCGRFKVRHFGVATSGYFSSFTVLRAIKEIVVANRDIKVWNLSLGSSMEINPNFISPEAAFLDKIQYENDVIFVVAGTNKPSKSNIKRIGAPADSINSLVVNSIGFDQKPASYSREGLVLSFFNKPDVSYYGGDGNKLIRACSPLGEAFTLGTSFAAPWISRKIAYLIHVVGMTKELAKALIIDAAAGWEDKAYSPQLIGYGVVPVKIDDILKTPNDEIKFMVSGESEKYNAYNFNIPIPEDKQKQPFVAKATLCYFPKCSRNQGVDYTNTELDIHFGRLTSNNGSIKIDTINENKQADEGKVLLYEGSARALYRKWDNVKHIRENIKTPTGLSKKPKKKYGNGLWGLSIKKKERLNVGDGEKLKFGVVITLKEVNGVNRIQEFIQQCLFRGWIVKKIDLENSIEIYNKASEEIEFG